MILEEGKTYSGKELAEWFGYKNVSGFAHNKEKKLQELNSFVDYELVGDKLKKYKILKVYNPVYSKSGSKNYQLVKENLSKYWNKSGLDTCKNVSEKIQEGVEDLKGLSLGTIYNYTLKSKKELYGHPTFTRNNKVYLKEKGEKGMSYYEWGKEDDEGNVVELTEKEKEIKNKLVQKYYGNLTDSVVMLTNDYDSGEINEEEFAKEIQRLVAVSGKINNMTSQQKYFAFKNALERELQTTVVKATRIVRNPLEESNKDEFYVFE